MEAGEDVGLRLKQRRAELDALRVRLAADGAIVEADEEAFERMLLERAEQLGKHHAPAPAATRSRIRRRSTARRLGRRCAPFGIGKIVVTLTDNGWSFKATATWPGWWGGVH